jgi:DNA-binding MarR family transcriptional regulator
MARTAGRHQDDARDLLRGIRALVRRFSVSERADVACCGMTVAQAAALEALRAGPLRMGALGQRLGIAPSTLTRNLGRLEEAGLVSRAADPDDARAFRVVLTKEGNKAADRLERQEEGFARAVLDLLPEDRRRAAVEALSDLLDAVRRATESCCPGAFDHLMSEFPREASRERRCEDDAACGTCE